MSPSPSTIPKTMRAWTYTRRGVPTDTLQLTVLPTPSATTLAADDLLIKVSHVALNIGFIVAFTLLPHLTSFPYIPELEFSGTVVAVGEGGSTQLKVGDQVIGARSAGSMWKHNGPLTEYIVAGAVEVSLKPRNQSMAEASGLVAVGCTCIQAVEIAGLKQGDKVFITGGSGGLGSMLVQVCRAIVGPSGVVVATCSGPNIDMVKKLGVDEVVDYTIHSPLHSYLIEHHADQPFDAIFDIAGDRALHTHSPSYLTTKGYFILLGDMSKVDSPSLWGLLSFVVTRKLERFRPVLLGGVPRNHRMYNAGMEHGSLDRIKQMVDEGQVKVLIDSVWPMEDAVKAYAKALTQRSRGKLVIQVEG